MAKDIDQEGALAAARGQPNVAKQLEGKEIKKVIFVPGEWLRRVQLWVQWRLGDVRGGAQGCRWKLGRPVALRLGVRMGLCAATLAGCREDHEPHREIK